MLLPVRVYGSASSSRYAGGRVCGSNPLNQVLTYTQQLDQRVLRVEVSRSWANRIEITAWGGSLEERRVSRFCIWS